MNDSPDPNELDVASFEAEVTEISRLIERTKSLQNHLQSHTYKPSKSPFTSPFPHRHREAQQLEYRSPVASGPPPSTSFIHPIPSALHTSASKDEEFQEMEQKYKQRPPSESIPMEHERFKKYKTTSSKSSSLSHDHGVVLEKFQMAKHYYKQGDYSKSLDCFSQCLAQYRRSRVKNCVFLCNILLGMGNCYYSQGNYTTARELYDRVDATLQKEREGLPDPTMSSKKQILATYGRIAPTVNSGLVAYQEGDFESALSYFLEALKCAENIVGMDRLVMSDIYHNIGVVFDEQGNIVGALKMYNKSVRIREKVLGKKHLLTALTYENIAQIYKDLRKYKEAIKLQKQVVDIRKSLLGSESGEFAMAMHKMGLILHEYGAMQKAIFYMEKAYKIRSKLLGESHPKTRESYRARNLMLRSRKK